jgi:hypothetical protein
MQTEIKDRNIGMHTYRDIYLRYDSWPEFVGQAEFATPTSYDYNTAHIVGYATFFGDTKTYEEAIKLAKHGWKEGADRIRNILAGEYNQLSMESLRPEVVMDIEGGSIDVGTFMTGDPECFVAWHDSSQLTKTPNGTNHVRIAYNISASGGYGAEDMITKGAHICALVDMLESHGRRVTLDLYDGTDSYRGKLFVKIELKAADAPLDLEKIAFSICHPSTLRRLLFGIEEALPAPFYHYTYCMPDDPPDMEADIKINATTLNPENQDMGVWIKQQLINQGVVFQDNS